MHLPKKKLAVLILAAIGTFWLTGCSDQDSPTPNVPNVVTLSPADDATGVAVDSNLVITFSENVDAEGGNITIKRNSDNSTVEVIDVTGAQVTGSGTDTITIDPTSDLESATGYYILIDAGAFGDTSGNTYMGISDTTSWDFTTLDCSNPNGPEELLTCMAEDEGKTAEAFWNTVLFDEGTLLDGFCRFGSSTGTEVQQYYFDTFCTEQSINYFSYQNFIDADKEMKNAMGEEYKFLRDAGTDKQARIRDFSNFLATGAQETTSAGATPPYTNDGFYFRWENGALNKCCSEADLGIDPVINLAWVCIDPSRVCDKTTNKYTAYTPGLGYKVAAKFDDDRQVWQVWTQTSWNSVSDNGQKKSGNEMDLTASPNVQSWNENIAPPPGYTIVNLNQVIEPYSWVGMGAIQLTADSVMNFFGWYYNNLEDPTKESADLNAFVELLAADGKLSFLGALWYWNYRVNGTDKPTIEKVLNYYEGKGKESPCHDIAISTILVNGGCNEFDKRKTYYNYFTNTAFGTPITPVTGIFDGVELDSMECGLNMTELQKYCTVTVFQ